MKYEVTHLAGSIRYYDRYYNYYFKYVISLGMSPIIILFNRANSCEKSNFRNLSIYLKNLKLVADVCWTTFVRDVYHFA